MKLELSFHGGAGTVTGSRHLLDVDGTRLLVDAGLFQGLKKLRLRNWRKTAFEPRSVDRLLLTHAHIDHSGYLPRLVHDGFKGPIHCTTATAELAHIMLRDAARIQEEDAAYANKRGYSRHKPALPLYTTDDAEETLELLRPTAFGTWVELGPGIRARFVNAGHILGSSHVELELGRPHRELRLVFSGDVGRYDVPLHRDPTPPPAADVMVIESTYGDRLHAHEPVEDELCQALSPTLERGGVVVVPAFAVGRSQLVTLMLRKVIKAGRLPDVPIHLDSPMAIDTTRLYSRHLDTLHLDSELVEDGRSRLFPERVYFHRSVHESKELNRLAGPRIIVASSGMLTGGRILHHLVRRLPDPKNLLVLVGYQAPGTRGRALLEGAKSLKIHGDQLPVRCQFARIHGLSAHADRDELLRWVKSAPSPPGITFVVHGEPESSQAFADLLESDLGLAVVVPQLEQSFDLEAMVEGR